MADGRRGRVRLWLDGLTPIQWLWVACATALAMTFTVAVMLEVAYIASLMLHNIHTPPALR